MNFRRIANSIVTRILLLGIVIVLVGVVARYSLLGSYLREDIEKVVLAQQQTLATYVAHDIDYKIRERQAMLKQLAKALPSDRLRRPDALRAWLGERHEWQPLFSQGLFVIDPAGRVLGDYPRRVERVGKNYGDRDYVRDALAGKAAIGRPVVGQVTKEPVLPLAVPIRKSTGEVQAVLVGITAIGAPGFLDLLQQGRIGESGGFLLVSPRDQLFVAASDPAVVLRATPPPGVNPLHDRAMAGYRGGGVTNNVRGIEEVAAMASVASTGWFVVARLPTAEAFGVVKRVQGFVLQHAAMAIVVFLLVATGSLLAIFRPLFRAAEHADKMTRGELPLEPLPIARADEIGHLTEAFNRLLVKLQATQAEFARMAHHDTLTGLPNRALLCDRVQQVLIRAHRNNTRLAVLFLDLDGFKAINDSLGHEAGDLALVQVAQRLQASIRETDTLARVGGDEFVIVIGDLGAEPGYVEESAKSVATKCLKAIDQPFHLRGQERSLGLSVGIALGDGQSDGDDLMSLADRAMYQAKQAGRGRYVMARATPD